MSVGTAIVSWLVVVVILAASFYFYSNHKYLTYVKTADSFDKYYLTIPQKVISSIMENGCKWPVLPVVDMSLRNSVTRFRNMRCKFAMDSFAFLDDFGYLEVSLPVGNGDPLANKSIICSYQPLRNTSTGGFLLGPPSIIEFNKPKLVHYDQFVVQCRRSSPSSEVIYEKAFVNGPDREPKFTKSNWEFPSLAVLIFDSVSLNHFKRNMPRTLKFMVDNDFVTMNMYNKVTDESDMNVLSILSGGPRLSPNQSFLWEAMKERQCMTYLSEEVGDFPSLLGNLSLDVEHDLRPFYAYLSRAVDGHCTPDGHVASRENLGNWRNSLLHSSGRCHFSMHYMRTLTRDNPEYLSLLDEELRESMETFKANGLFEDTVFAIVSGRGNPLRARDQSFTARVEELSPLFSIKIPEKYLKKYPRQRSNIGANANRLISTTDIALTLMDIASSGSFIQPKNVELALKNTSLLRIALPSYRSCDDANIPPYLCLCMDEKEIQSEDYPSSSFEFKQLYEYVKAEILKNDCIEKVFVSDDYGKLTVLSLSPMVQHRIKNEKDWIKIKKIHHHPGMNYVEITVEAHLLPKDDDTTKGKLLASMRFRHTRPIGFEPVGAPVVYWTNQRCFTKRMEQFCEMCYYNRLLTE